MTLIRCSALLVCAVFLVGCGGESGSKTAVPATNAAPKPPAAVGEGENAAPPATAIDAAE
jgi:hypothetical protein